MARSVLKALLCAPAERGVKVMCFQCMVWVWKEPSLPPFILAQPEQGLSGLSFWADGATSAYGGLPCGRECLEAANVGQCAVW